MCPFSMYLLAGADRGCPEPEEGARDAPAPGAAERLCAGCAAEAEAAEATLSREFWWLWE